jgi:hypothetical protein
MDSRMASRWAALARIAALGALTALALVAIPATASAATYFVTETGNDANDCSSVAQACATVQRAIEEHRVSPQPDDVIDVGPGTFVGNFAADDPDDDGLRIQGTLSGGTRQTTLRGTGDGFGDSGTAFWVGGCGGPKVKLRNAEVDTVGADPAVYALDLDGGSGLVNVHATNQPGSTATVVVFACERGSSIERSEIVATDEDSAIAVLDSLTLADSTVTTETAAFPAIVQFSGCGCVRMRIRRSEVSAPPSTDPGDAPVVYSSQRLTVDSSLITGGLWGVQTSESPDWRINNSTIDAGEPGVSDPNNPSLNIFDPFDAADVTVDSSLLVDPIEATDQFDVGGTVSCDFSDLPAANLDPNFTDDCEIGGGSTNTTTPPDDLFVAGDPYDWRLLPDAPAVDTGAPGPPPAGMTLKDLADNPRRAAGSTATCPDGTRDKGAYEFLGPPCVLQDPEILGGANPSPSTKLSSSRGEFNNKPTAYARLWLRCDAGGDNCVEIAPPRTRQGYTVRGDDVGHTLRLQVIASNAAGDSEPALSDPTGVVAE